MLNSIEKGFKPHLTTTTTYRHYGCVGCSKKIRAGLRKPSHGTKDTLLAAFFTISMVGCQISQITRGQRRSQRNSEGLQKAATLAAQRAQLSIPIYRSPRLFQFSRTIEEVEIPHHGSYGQRMHDTARGRITTGTKIGAAKQRSRMEQ